MNVALELLGIAFDSGVGIYSASRIGVCGLGFSSVSSTHLEDLFEV